MKDELAYLRMAFLRWETLRPLYSLIVMGILYELLHKAGAISFSKDTLIAAGFTLIVINAVYCLCPLLEGALCLFTGVRLGRARYALWALITALPVFKFVWLWQTLTFYFTGYTIYRG